MSIDEKLINLVQLYPVIYDITCKHYYDQVMKEQAWEEIAQTLNETSDEMKKRWTCLRDCFRKSLIKRNRTTGPKSKLFRPWKYEEEMSFLTPHFAGLRKLKRSKLTKLHSDIGNKDGPGIENDTFNEENNNGNHMLVLPLQVEVQSNVSSQSLDMPKPSRSCLTTPVTAEKRVKRQQQTRVVHKLPTYQNDKYENRHRTPQPAPDHLRSFFKAIEDTVLTFSPLQQVQLKSQIYSMVSKIEISNLLSCSVYRQPCESEKLFDDQCGQSSPFSTPSPGSPGDSPQNLIPSPSDFQT